MKKAVLLALVLCTLNQTPVRADTYVEPYSHVTIEVAEDYASSNTEFGSFELNGKYIQLPCKASLIMDLGLVPEEEIKVPGKSIADWVHLYDSQGRELTLSAYNTSRKSVGLEDCTVYMVRHDFSEDKEIGYLDFTIMGVSGDTDPATLETVLGKPSNSYSYDESDTADWRSGKRERYVSVDWNTEDILEVVTYVYPPEEVNGYRYSDEIIPYELVEAIPTAVGSVIIIVGVAIIFVKRKKKKRKMSTQDILNTPLGELADSVLEKYGEEDKE